MNSICKTASKAAAKLEELGKSAAEIRQEREERSADKSQGAEKHLAEFEAKAKQQNAATANNVLDFKPKAQDEVVMA